MGEDKKPLLIRKDVLFLYRILMNFTSLFEKPILFIVLYRKLRSILSNDFSWPICRVYSFVFFSLANVILSLIKNKLLKIVCVGMEHVRCCEIIFGKMFFSLFDRNFISILWFRYKREIELQCFSLSRLPFFGISVMMASFMVFEVFFQLTEY